MSIRNYNDAILQNENSRIAIVDAGLKHTFTTLFYNEDVYLAWDDGAGFYTTTVDKNVHVESDGLVTTGGQAISTVFAMGDVLGSYIQAQVGNLIHVYYARSSTVRQFVMIERVNSVNQDFVVFDFNYENIHYWRENKIDWDAATLTVTWYTNELRTITAFTPQVISLTKDRTLRYMYGQEATNLNIGPLGGTTGFEQNFNQISPSVSTGMFGSFVELQMVW